MLLKLFDSRQSLAVSLMVLAIVAHSPLPLVLSVVDGESFPFQFSASVRVGVAAAHLIFLVLFHSRLFSGEFIQVIRQSFFSPALFLVFVANLDFALYFLAARYVDVSIALLLFESVCTLAIILLLGYLFRREGQYERLSPFGLVLVLTGILGLSVVISSEAGRLVWLDFDLSQERWPLGVAIAVSASLVSSLAVFGFRWGVDLSRKIEAFDFQYSSFRLALVGISVSQVLGNTVGAVSTVGIGAATQEAAPIGVLVIGFATGIGLVGISSIAVRASLLMTVRPSINALVYTQPGLSLALLWVFSKIEVARLDYLLFGFAIVLGSTVAVSLIQGKPVKRKVFSEKPV